MTQVSTTTVSDPLTLLTEDLVSFAEIAKELRVHVATVHRWRLRGIQGTTLEAVKVGGRLLTTRQAVNRFLSRTQPPSR